MKIGVEGQKKKICKKEKRWGGEMKERIIEEKEKRVNCKRKRRRCKKIRRRI